MIRHRYYWTAASAAACLLLVLLVLIGAASGTPRALAQGENEADVIVQFGDQDLSIRSITFTTPISGLRALELTGLEIGTYDFGGGFIAVCSVEGVGCPATAEGCFCGGNTFWNYNFWDGSQWQGYPIGAASSVISETGAIEGWRWGEFSAPAADPQAALAAERALVQLRTTQEPNGGHGTMSATTDVMLALGANRQDGAAWTAPGGASILDYWQVDDIDEDEYANNAARFAATSPASAGKLLLAAQAAGADPAAFAGLDLLQLVQANYDASTGAYGPTNWDQALSMLAVASASTSAPPSSAAAELARNGNEDGSWDYLPDGTGDTNSTALVIQALRAAGACPRKPLVEDALTYLKRAQNEDGGFGFTPGAETDANSTAFVIQALIAAERNPAGGAWTMNDNTPLDALLALQLADGNFEWQAGGGSNALATQQAVPALLRTPFVAAEDLARCTEIFLPLVAGEVE